MFKQIQGTQIPVGNVVEKLEIVPATLSPGFILYLHRAGRIETLVFPTQHALTQALFTMFNAANIAAMSPQPPAGAVTPAVPQVVTEDALKKIAEEAGRNKQVKAASVQAVRSGGETGGARRGPKAGTKLTDEQKAQRNATRAANKAAKLNGKAEEHPAGAEVQADEAALAA